jgi:hypothetical protein
MFLFTANVNATESVSRVINIVYDDSSSMIYRYYEKEYVDYWAKAKFSLELLCSSMGENDVINIYPMSDYSNLNAGILAVDMYTSEKSPILSLYGGMTPTERIDAINNMVTEALDTPFYAVGKAFNDLNKTTADEKWLVVLTDGEFDELISGDSLSQQFYQFKDYDPSIKIMYLGMDSSAFRIEEDINNEIFTEYADNPDEILSTFTKISYRLFNRNELQVSSGNRIEFDVPMKKIVIFAQGDNVEINDIVLPDGTRFSPTSKVVIPTSEIAASNYQDNSNVVYNYNLTGVVAEYEYDINEGNYRIEVENANDVEVFYYPSVGMTVNLINFEGTNVYGNDEINSGTYKIEYKFINSNTQEELTNTDLLGEVTYSSKLIRDGEVIMENIANGDEIELLAGLDTLTISADYLTYNSVEEVFEFNVVDYSVLNYTIIDKPIYEVGLNGYNNLEQPIKVQVSVNGVAIEKEFWDKMPVPFVGQVNSGLVGLVYMVEKSVDIGVYNVYINEEVSKIDYQVINEFLIQGSFEEDQIYYSGQAFDTAIVVDAVPGYLRFLIKYKYFLMLIPILIIFILLLILKNMPKIIYFHVKRVSIDGEKVTEDVRFDYKRKEQELIVNIYSVFNEMEYVKFNLLPTESYLMAKLKNPDKISIKSIETSSLVKEIVVGKETFIKEKDNWIREKYANSVENLSKKQSIVPEDKNIVIKLVNGIDLRVYGTIQRY